MRVAIVGAAGQLGTELMAAFAAHDPIALTHDRFDIEDAACIETMLRDCKPELVINTAAFHNVDRCEAEPERAFAVNAVAVGALATKCRQAGAALAHISTDYVFDGNTRKPYVESDRPRPLNVYGISKFAGEMFARERTDEAYLFRTSGLYALRGVSAKGKPFVERMLEGAQTGTPLRVVDDITFSPTFAKHAALAIREIVERGAYGLYHVTNGGACTWHQFATEILRQAGYEYPIERSSGATTPSPVKRPPYSALAHTALENAGLEPMPLWQQGIAEYLEERAARAAQH